MRVRGGRAGARGAGRGVCRRVWRRDVLRGLARHDRRSGRRRRVRRHARPPSRRADDRGRGSGEARPLRKADGPQHRRMRSHDRGLPGPRRASRDRVLPALLSGRPANEGTPRRRRDRRSCVRADQRVRVVRSAARPSTGLVSATRARRGWAHVRLRLPSSRGPDAPVRTRSARDRHAGQRPLHTRRRGHRGGAAAVRARGLRRGGGDACGDRAARHASRSSGAGDPFT